MKTCIVTIATGEQYWPFALDMIRSAKLYFPDTTELKIGLFTDAPLDSDLVKEATWSIGVKAKGFPQETLMRFETILLMEKYLEGCDQIFWVDADMLFVAPVEDIYSSGITATLHPGYPPWNPTGVTEKTRRHSTAYVDNNKYYYCGGFNGGDAKTFLNMARILKGNIDKDLTHGIIAIHNDESHLNWYLHHNPPAKTLTPSYCYPEPTAGPGYNWVFDAFKPILIAREKGFAK